MLSRKMDERSAWDIAQFFFWFVPLIVGAVAVTGASYLFGSLSIGTAAVIFLVGFVGSVAVIIWALKAGYSKNKSEDNRN